MVRGGIRFYKTFPDKQEYMEGLSYVPARFTNFVKLLLMVVVNIFMVQICSMTLLVIFLKKIYCSWNY